MGFYEGFISGDYVVMMGLFWCKSLTHAFYRHMNSLQNYYSLCESSEGGRALIYSSTQMRAGVCLLPSVCYFRVGGLVREGFIGFLIRLRITFIKITANGAGLGCARTLSTCVFPFFFVVVDLKSRSHLHVL